jgi:hypothetical protein
MHGETVKFIVHKLTFDAIILFVQNEQYIHNTQDSIGAPKVGGGWCRAIGPPKRKLKTQIL